MRRAQWTLVALLALAVLGAVATPAFASNDPRTAHGGVGALEAPGGGNWTYEQLRQTGSSPVDGYPGFRVIGEMSTLRFVRYPPNGFNTFGEGYYVDLEPTSKVRRNRIRVWANHPFDGESRNYTARVVYWHPDQRTVTRETANGTVTTTERYANVTGTGEQTLTFRPGFKAHDDVRLRGHYGDGERVTIFVDAGDETVVVSFYHQSIRTAQPVNIDGRGELYSWALLWIILPSVLVGGVTAVGAHRLREAAGHGPGYPAWMWLLAALFTLGGVYLFGYLLWASIVATVPFALSGLVAWTVGSLLLEADTGNVGTWTFVQMDPEEFPSPIDREQAIKTASKGYLKRFKVVETGDGETALYHWGIRPFIARALGHYAVLSVDNLRAEFEMTGDTDKLVVVSEDAELGEAVRHAHTTWLVKWPWRTDERDSIEDEDLTPRERQKAAALPERIGWSGAVRTFLVFATIIASGWGAHLLFRAGGLDVLLGLVVGYVGLAAYYAVPLKGWAHAEAAAGHARAAWVTPWYINLNLKRFASLEEVMEYAEEGHRRASRMESYVRDRKTEGLIAQSFDEHPMSEPLLEEDPALGETGPDVDADEGEGRDAAADGGEPDGDST